MIALIFLVLSFLLGCNLLRKFRLSLNAFELSCAGMLLGSLISTWTVFLISLALGQTTGIPVALAALALATTVLAFKGKTPISYPRFSAGGVLIYLAFTVFWIGVLLPLFTSHMLQSKSDGLYSGGGTWGDLALHSTFVHKFAGGDRINLTSPIYAGEKTTYPFLFDFYASIFLRYGWSVQASLVFSAFLFSMLFLQLAFFLVWRMFKSLGAGLVFSILFLFNGGIGAFYAFQDWMSEKVPLLTFLFSMKVEYAHLAVYGLRFSNLIADYLLPQRAFLVGLPAFILTLMIFRTIWLEKEERLDLKLLLGALVGMLPLFHTHTFLALSGFTLFFIMSQALLQRKNPLSWTLPLILMAAIAFPQLNWQFAHTFGEGFIRFQYGWMKEKQDLIVFWLRNLGLEALFFIVGGGYLLLFERKQRFLQLVFAAFSILFVITNLIVFQPHDYDNMKLMIYSHLAISLMTAWLLLKIWRFNFLGKVLALILFAGLTLTGGLSVLRESYTSWKIATTADIEISKFIKQKTDPTAIFVTADSHNHPVTMLSGRSTLMGYRGWLWTHGINYAQTEKDVYDIFSGAANTPLLLSTYKVSYVYIGGAELNDFNANIKYFRRSYPVVFENESGVIFDVRGSPLPTIANTVP